MKVVLVMFKDGERRDFPVTGEKTIVGRRHDCGLRIPTGDVSRQHCEITVDKTEVTVRDLGSSNGTYVNGKRVAESRLQPGDKLSVGPTVFVVQINGNPLKITPFDAKVEPAAKPAGGAKPAAAAAKTPAKPAAKKPHDDEDTEDILDLGDLEFDENEDPLAAVEALLDDDDDDEDEVDPKRRKRK